MEAIVLAGGLGTRLASRLNGIPKPMAPVAGRPFLEILLSNLQRAGCSRALLSVGHLADSIQQHFGDAFQGMPLQYVVEASPLGTGGAIRTALAQAAAPHVLVLNGDTYAPLDYAAMLAAHAAGRPDVTLAVSHQADVARYGEVLLAGAEIVGFREKGRVGPGWINAGVYVLDRNFRWPAGLAERFSFETDVLMAPGAGLRMTSFPAGDLFIDIGVPEDLDRAQTVLAEV